MKKLYKKFDDNGQFVGYCIGEVLTGWQLSINGGRGAAFGIGEKTVAYVHTHGKYYGWRNDCFSFQDTNMAR